MGQGPSSAADVEKVAQKNIAHFETTYDAIFISASEGVVPPPPTPSEKYAQPALQKKLGSAEGRVVAMVMKFEKVEVKERIKQPGSDAPKSRSLCAVPYSAMKSLDWDHSVSSVRLVSRGTSDKPDDIHVVLKVANSLELESEAKLRLRALAQASNITLSFNYVGVYAGPTKPKPFQRKRANLSMHEQGKLPPLSTMRDVAIARHRGSGAPAGAGQSKRYKHALDVVRKGCCQFTVVSCQEKGKPAATEMLQVESKLQLCAGYADVPGFVYAEGQKVILQKQWDDLQKFEIYDKAHQGESTNGVMIEFTDGKSYFFVILDVLQVAECLEHYWNRRQAKKGQAPLPRSTHGRDVLKITTLTGEIAAPPAPAGDLDVLDEFGVLVRQSKVIHEQSVVTNAAAEGDPTYKKQASGGAARRKSTLVGAIVKGKKSSDFKLNPTTDKYWDAVVKHQGWLLKKGGLGKTWIKRYAVLYSTSMGHFLCYYADFAKSPLFHTEPRERNVIDLCKTTFVRPVSNNKEAPTNSFDICTIEREWTLSAETKGAMQQWLQVMTRAIDEDVAIVPDDELVFVVKPRVDPTGKLLKNEYSCGLKVSASGVSVCHITANDEYQERFFWCYTDFFKWSILHHSGKTGLQISVFTSTSFDMKDRHEFLFRTRDAVKLATAIEFYIEKFMAAMHLYLESPGSTRAAVAADGAGAMAWDAQAMNQEALQEDDLIGGAGLLDDDDDKPGGSSNGAATNQSILDLFTVSNMDNNNNSHAAKTDADPFATSSGPPQALHDPDDPFAPKPVTHPVFAGPEEVKEELPVGSLDDAFGAAAIADDDVPNQQQPVLVDATETMLASDSLFDKLARLCEPSGALYKNEAVSVNLQQEYRGSQGRVVLTVQNDYPPLAEGGHAIEHASIDVDLGASGLRHHLAELSTSLLEPGESASAQLMLECMQPYDEAPAAILKFVIASQPYELKVALPALFTKFLEPVDLAAQVFVQRWETLGAPGLECMTTFQATAGPAGADTAKPRLETLINVAFVQGIDDSNGTILSAAAALRTGTANAGGDKISVGCLIRLEMNAAANAYRLTVRTAVPRVSEALSRAITKVL